MKKRNDLDRELMELSRYQSLKISRSYLLICLALLSGYLITQSLLPKPFYICLVLLIFPGIFEVMFPKNQGKPFHFAYLKHRLKYTKNRYLSMLASFGISQALMILWAKSYTKLEFIEPFVKFSPAILIISSFFLYTIGQYYYFLRFRHHILTNSVEQIKKSY